MKPNGFDAVIFDMDGVITQTATLHASAWKATFDEYLQRRKRQVGDTSPPFDIEADYRKYVDGKPRHEGVRSFLAARGIDLPEGDPDDDAGTDTVQGLGRHKDVLFIDQIRRAGSAAPCRSVRLRSAAASSMSRSVTAM